MEHKKSGSVEWLEFDLLQGLPLRHGVFLRNGGFSHGSYKSLNVSYDVGDDAENVRRNIEVVQELMQEPKLSHAKLKWANQCHGKNIASITHSSPDETVNCDALTTSNAEIGLMIKHADCQAAIIYDPMQNAISVVHSGWRGSVQNIYAETIERMKKAYGSKPENLLVCISPSLGPLSAEFINYKHELPEKFWDFQIKPDYFDFWAISEDQLKNCGVLLNHIEIMRIDTFENREDCFSFRRDKVTGRHATVAVLNDFKV